MQVFQPTDAGFEARVRSNFERQQVMLFINARIMVKFMLNFHLISHFASKTDIFMQGFSQRLSTALVEQRHSV
jgi:hypothetical protein